MSVVNPVAVKVRGKAPGARNELCWVFEKGVSLPARGAKLFRAARELTSGEKSHYLNLEFYQGQDEGLSETEPLFIGSVEITGKHLGDGLKIRAGDKITLRWEMGVGSILRTMVEFPHLGRRPGNFYIPQRAHSRLDLARETKIVRGMLEAARREAGVLRSAFGDGANAECEKICREIESRRGILDNAGEAGATHRVATETRRILARISGLKHAPENRGKVLRQKIHDESRDWFSRYIRPEAAPKTVRLFDAHKDDGLACIDEGDLQAAEFHIREAEKIGDMALRENFGFLRDQFNLDIKREPLAVDPEAYRRTLQQGFKAIDEGDFRELREVIDRLRGLQVAVDVARRPASDLASITEA